MGLYSGMNGHISLDASLPLFLVQDGRIVSSTHSADGIHAELRKTNDHVRGLWKYVLKLVDSSKPVLKSGVFVNC